MNQGDVSRRSFVKTAGSMGLGFAALGVLSSCSSQSSNMGKSSVASDVSWDQETDILVVGSGTAAFAALVAKANDVEKVTIIEKSSIWGGTSATSGGALWVPLFYAGQSAGMSDTREDALAYMKLVAEGRGNNAAMELYVDNANTLLEWTRDSFGWEWVTDTPGMGFKDYYEPLKGFRPQGRQASVSNGGAGLWSLLQKEVEDLGVEVLMETAAEELVVDELGSVVGVKAKAGSKELFIKASRCVVLGTGGFDHNASMVREFQSIPVYVTNAAEGNVGDAQIMGGAQGAALANMDTNWGLPSFIPEPFDANADAVFSIPLLDWGIYRAGAGSIVVNKAGKRFANEASAYAVFNRAFGNYDTSEPGHPNIPAVWICDSNYLASGGGLLPGMKSVDDALPANIFKADSMGQIAEHFGIDPEGLANELEKFNSYAEQGVDSDWKRGEKEIDRAIGAYHPYLSSLPNPVLAPLSTPPFYASLYVPGTCGTNGGLKTNEYAQVLTTQGEIIPGLLAVGNCSASITGGQYCGAGMTLGAGAVMSWIGIRKLLDIV